MKISMRYFGGRGDKSGGSTGYKSKVEALLEKGAQNLTIDEVNKLWAEAHEIDLEQLQLQHDIEHKYQDEDGNWLSKEAWGAAEAAIDADPTISSMQDKAEQLDAVADEAAARLALAASDKALDKAAQAYWDDFQKYEKRPYAQAVKKVSATKKDGTPTAAAIKEAEERSLDAFTGVGHAIGLTGMPAWWNVPDSTNWRNAMQKRVGAALVREAQKRAK